LGHTPFIRTIGIAGFCLDVADGIAVPKVDGNNAAVAVGHKSHGNRPHTVGARNATSALPLPPGNALQSAADTNPANGGLAESCPTNAAELASTTSTTLLTGRPDNTSASTGRQN
jgi:hypothetical protein